MGRLWALAALLQVLLTHTATISASYACLEEQDTNATNEALHIINELHHHGYKFRLVSVDSRTAQEKADPCEVVLALTLEETKCHIVNPEPFTNCELRSEAETKVIAKCNVTMCGGEHPGIKKYTCDTEPASTVALLHICPDCPILLPLHDPKGLESVKAALEMYNSESNHTSYFKLLEVGRITSQHNMMFGQSYFVQFAIVETECADSVKTEGKNACKPLCDKEADYGFCQATQLGNGDLNVDCDIYDAQNTTHHHHHPFYRRHCGHRRGHHPHKGHHHHHHHHHPPGHGKRPDHAGSGHDKRPAHAGPGHDKHPDHTFPPGHQGDHHQGCFHRSGHPHHRGPPHHRVHPHHGDHHEHKKDPTKPTRAPHHPLTHSEPTAHLPGSSDPEFPFPECHGFVKIPPSIHPICPFPPTFMRRPQKAHA